MPALGSLRGITREPKFETVELHGGQEPVPINGSQAVPLFQKYSYNFMNASDGVRNPPVSVFEQRMSMLEGGVGAVATVSGHAAQFMAMTSSMKSGYNFVSTSWLYSGTYNQFCVYLKKFKIDVKWVEGQDPEAIAAAIDDKTRAVYIETIGNPKHSTLPFMLY